MSVFTALALLSVTTVNAAALTGSSIPASFESTLDNHPRGRSLMTTSSVSTLAPTGLPELLMESASTSVGGDPSIKSAPSLVASATRQPELLLALLRQKRKMKPYAKGRKSWPTLSAQPQIVLNPCQAWDWMSAAGDQQNLDNARVADETMEFSRQQQQPPNSPLRRQVRQTKRAKNA
ncbi:hypothetical protein RvY_08354 [Ramazzottius varieornatus]|uniref:Uncharacterized protein n=1 Tax=Ramazzottius varieornatus TaxID=947166 RepID=A0A1D1V5M1_RAMVA|nr:hypothetical protein RvY_08354 [Ramazzottius varieornatus]